MKHRILRLNSLLREVIAEVVRDEVRNPKLHPLTSIAQVEVSADLRHAKVHVSVLGSEEERAQTLEALQSAASFIGIVASKRIVIRFFPELLFKLDRTVDKQMRIDTILREIEQKSPRSDGSIPSN